MNFGESIALAGLRGSSIVSNAAYIAAKSATSASAPFVLQFFCIIHEKILTKESQKAMNDFIELNMGSLHTKYEIFSVLCKNENIDPMAFIREHQAMVETMLKEIGLDPRIVETQERLTQSINQNFQSILAYIQTKTEVLKNVKLTGGRRRKTNVLKHMKLTRGRRKTRIR
jgi:hypothetical protein